MTKKQNNVPITEQSNIKSKNIDIQPPNKIVEIIQNCETEIFGGYKNYKGINDNDINKGIKTYLGVEKRFDYIYRSPNISLLLDIAHHPVAIKECQKNYDEIIVLYRPHMYKELNEDKQKTITALELADKIVLLEIESVKDVLGNGLNANKFVFQQKHNNKWFYFKDDSKIINWLSNLCSSKSLIIQMGMYLDTELTEKIKNILKYNY